MNGFQRNEFRPYRATAKVHLGPIERDIYEGEVLETDGYTVKYDGETFAMTQVRTCIAESWFVPLDDRSGRRYVAQPADLQMHSPTPNRDGTRSVIHMGVSHEDHHVVNSIGNSNLGATSERTRIIRENAPPDPRLQQEWQQQQPAPQYQDPQSQLDGQVAWDHQPLQQSNPRYAAQRVDPRALSAHEMVQTLTGQEAHAAVALPPTQKARDDSTRRVLSGTNAHGMAQSVMSAAEQRSQQRQIASRKLAAEKRAQKALQGQSVGINGLGPAGQGRFQGGDINQQDAQVVRTVSQGQRPQWNDPNHTPPAPQWQGGQEPPQHQAPQGYHDGAPEVSPQEWAEFQAFQAFKRQQSQQALSQTHARQAGLAQAHITQNQMVQPQHQAPPTQPAPQAQEGGINPYNWEGSTEGMQWAARAKAAVDLFGENPKAIQSILDSEPSKGARNSIRKRMGYDKE